MAPGAVAAEGWGAKSNRGGAVAGEPGGGTGSSPVDPEAVRAAAQLLPVRQNGGCLDGAAGLGGDPRRKALRTQSHPRRNQEIG